MIPIAPPILRNTTGTAVANLQDAIQLLIKVGQLPLGSSGLGLMVAMAKEHDTSYYGPNTLGLIQLFQRSLNIDGSGDIGTDVEGTKTADVINEILTKNGAFNSPPPPPSTPNQVSGTLTFDNALPATGVMVRLYGKVFAQPDSKLAETISDAKGTYALAYAPPPLGANVEVRAVDAQGKETPISTVLYNSAPQVTANLIAPSTVQPPASEYTRLSADMTTAVGGILNLAQAQETDTQTDITLLSQSTGWDARLLALAATAAQQTTTTGLSHDVLYALYRTGLPTDPAQLAATPISTITTVLNRTNQSGLTSFTDQQITNATTAFQSFATTTQLAQFAPGGVSTYSALLNAANVGDQQTNFNNLVLSQPTPGADFWHQVANLPISTDQVNSLRLQGKCFYLTLNNLPLSQRILQDVTDLSQLPAKGYHDPSMWKSVLTGLAGTGEGSTQTLSALIPAIYKGATSDPLGAYAAELARKVRVNYPTQTAAQLVETGQLPLGASAPPIAAFLRAASGLGYKLGRTPLNVFLNKFAPAQATGAAAAQGPLPPLSDDDRANLKTLHRLFQVTPSTESLQAALNLKFTSAQQISQFTLEQFLRDHASDFPPGEAQLVHAKAQQISAVTFNFYAAAKQLDANVPVYALSSSPERVQAAKNSIIEQFPSMGTLFGNMDFCQCPDWRSVLSPAAYFVDLLEFLGPPSNNDSTYTPLDTLIGSVDGVIKGRRPDLAALPLTGANTDTALPYIDVVNEILEYYICNRALDGGLAFDTGATSTDDLKAEPQNIFPQAYLALVTGDQSFGYPLGLPFDLWLETVRSFYAYLKTPLAEVLEVFRPVDPLELFAPVPAPAASPAYYRSAIYAEALGLSPSDYAIFTDPSALTKWFSLYGYPTGGGETLAFNGGTFPAAQPNFDYPSLTTAKYLAQYLGVTYQELTDLLTTGFLNPKLAAISFQFARLGLNLQDAFSYTSQPGYPPLDPDDTAAFEATLAALTQKYNRTSSPFDAKTWLQGVLPANYSKGVLVLDGPASGCDFSATTLIYADLVTKATNLDLLKFNLFVRLWRKLGWTMDETDRALQLFFATGAGLPDPSDPGFGAAFASAWQTALVYLSHLDDLYTQWQPPLGRIALLPLWAPLATAGNNPLYAQIFLTPAVLNSDPAFDNPTSQFPLSTSDVLSKHQPGIQGALGLSADDVTAILADAGSAVTTVATTTLNGQNVQAPSFSLNNLSLLYRYNLMATSLGLTMKDFIGLKTLSVDMGNIGAGIVGLNPFASPTGTPLKVLQDNVLFTQTLQFVNQASLVANSGFSVEDLRYLLLHNFDPVGKYQTDTNALLTLAEAVAAGVQQIQTANAVPDDLTGMSDDSIQQRLSSLVPATLLTNLVGLLTNGTAFTATQASVIPANQVDPKGFSNDPELTFGYDTTLQVQTLSYTGAVLDWKRSQLVQLNPAAPYKSTLDNLLSQVQQAQKAAFDAMVGNILSIWGSLIQYEATQSMANPLAFAPGSIDPALEIGYDADNKIQWASYRGVLTDAKLNALPAASSPADLIALLTNIQKQAVPAFSKLLNTLLGLWGNIQSYQVTQSTVAPADQIDSALLTGFPQIILSYDPVGQNQIVTCQGVWTAAMQSALTTSLASLIPAANAAQVTMLNNLLQALRAQALSCIQAQAANWATVTDANLDAYVLPFVGLDPTKMLKVAKGALIQVFSPLLSAKLCRGLVIQSLSSALSSDSSLTGSLLTDASLLSDPANPGHSLLGAFLDVETPGITATYYASADQTGAALGGGSVASATASTADGNNPSPAAVESVRFEGYLQVTTDGPYRFSAEFANSGAQANLQLDAPLSAPSIANPVLTKGTASQYVDLKGGLLYHYILDFTALGAGGAGNLFVESELLPKGPLNQIRLYPIEAMDRFAKGRTILAKALQLIQGAKLNQSEVAYLTAHSDQFNDFNLSTLPTEPSSDAPATALAKAEKLFAQFLTLADYADLKKGPAGGSDTLTTVFESVGQVFTEVLNSGSSNQDPNAPWTILGTLTRRDPQVVRAVAIALGLVQETDSAASSQLVGVGDLANNKGIRRIWEALQIIQTTGLPVSAVIDSTKIVSASRLNAATDPGTEVAGNLRNAVKSKYTSDGWRPVAQSVFDPLRQKKRDALVAYIVRDLQLENSNQIFEYFLVDAGMEPIVQTSRLRLALSSVQTFVQRCLLNLESSNTQNPKANVAPSAINADWWGWMKRYRVWEANREIFLYPENWMEPELRLDKTDLFQTLESTLLQGDITSDLVEDAFYKYLQGLETRARLDIVATYLEQTGIPDKNGNYLNDTLHVVGRTHAQPHQYFYRTYSNGVWTAWIPVTTAIDGDHLAVVVWRNRVNIFWVTFQPKPKQGENPPPDPGKNLTDLNFGQIQSLAAQQQIQVQLNWSEFFQGKWSERRCSDVNQYSPVAIPGTDPFDPSTVYIHVSKEAPMSNSSSSNMDGPVLIHLGFASNDPEAFSYRYYQPRTYSFRVTSKNCNPDFSQKYEQPPPTNPYFTAEIVNGPQFAGWSSLGVEITTEISSDGSSTLKNQSILNTVNAYALVLCSNPTTPPFLASTDPLYSEAGALVSPFFYKDVSDQATADELTFFVQPSFTESVEEFPGYVIGKPLINPILADPLYAKQIDLTPQVPARQKVLPSLSTASSTAVYAIKNPIDWLTSSTATIAYHATLIGQVGATTALQDKTASSLSAIGDTALVGNRAAKSNNLKSNQVS